MDDLKRAMQRASQQARPPNQDEERARYAWPQNVKVYDLTDPKEREDYLFDIWGDLLAKLAR